MNRILRHLSFAGSFCQQGATTFESCLNTMVVLPRPGRIYATSDGNADSGSAGVTDVLGKGSHQIRLECKGNGTLPGPRVFSPSITTLTLGPG